MATITVMDWQRALLFTYGRFTRVLEPGRHRYRPGRSSVHSLDVRRRATVVAGQELLTSDGITLKLSVLAVWAVGDPLAFLMGSADAEQDLYAGVQLAVRDSVATTSFDEVVADRGRLSAGLQEATTSHLGGLGIDLVSVTVKDLMLPADLRRAATETLLARENGRAELERSRAEAAALRVLANTGRLLEEHPALLQLRTIQAAGTPGTTIVLTADPGRPWVRS
jgi:regulator of protease activity HflC (stomatin/prohibitin superfamily)